MTDSDLRALERRFRESGGLEDHTRWLSARVRAGELSEHRVRLAAELGHAAAGRALGVEPAPLEHDFQEGLRAAAAFSRQPGALADAHWVLTGRALEAAPSFEPPIDEDDLHNRATAAIRELACARAWSSGEAPPSFTHAAA